MAVEKVVEIVLWQERGGRRGGRRETVWRRAGALYTERGYYFFVMITACGSDGGGEKSIKGNTPLPGGPHSCVGGASAGWGGPILLSQSCPLTCVGLGLGLGLGPRSERARSLCGGAAWRLRTCLAVEFWAGQVMAHCPPAAQRPTRGTETELTAPPPVSSISQRVPHCGLFISGFAVLL